MKTLKSLAAMFSLLGLTSVVQAQLITIEPDDFSSPTILNSIFPQVSLVTAGTDNVPYPFDVTAVYDSGFAFASTGTNVFGHGGGIPFWNNFRRLRMDFATPINFVAIDFIGGDYFSTDIGKLDVFNNAGLLLASYTSTPQPPDSGETLSISRPTGDITWAVAYLPENGGSFGRFDRLQFGVVPEPSVLALLVCAVGTRCLRSANRRR